ncbi:adenylosuccinate synthetase [Candidatus Saccharibacteria bacterium]|nr:adenylosuccinate synthetase [Candidatus Saccharibacteria bacterium]MBR3143824.1 adenylosuccinate synthetase [Candidatus Saccharibacteria bacterium]
MFEKIYVVTDLGPGDGGKGGVVHALSCKIDASVIIKRGGAQGSHGVCTSYGDSFNFSQWGCGTFEGVPTFLSEQMVIMPVGLENESEALKRLGIYDPYTLLSVDPLCICATPLHKISSRLEELKLGKNPRGTIGTGVGRAYRMKDELGEDFTIYAHELKSRDKILKKLQRQLDYYREKYANFSKDDSCTSDIKLIAENLDLLYDNDFLPYIVDVFENVGRKIRLKNLSEILNLEGNAVVECSHGVLTDAEMGFKPHVSAIRTLPEFTFEMLRDAGYNGDISNLAVHRAYEIRHGAGPMPTYDAEFTSRMLPGSHKDENRWQGIVRAGPLDLNFLRYALDAARETPFDGLCLTWFDQILATGRIWPICFNYADVLGRIKPLIREYEIKKPITKSELFELVGGILEKEIHIPLKMLSIGSTELDKISSKKL